MRFLLFLGFVFPILLSAYADNMVVGKVENAHGIFLLRRDAQPGATTISIELNEAAVPIWQKSWQNYSDGQNLLNFWQIVDGYTEGNSVSVLIGMHRGLMWIRATQHSGIWQIDFTQEIYGAASREHNTTAIRFGDLDAIVVTDSSGNAVRFTRNTTGQVLKDGTPFNNITPGISVSNP